MTPAPQVDPAPRKGAYANYVEVGFTAFEIVIDFGQRYGMRETPCHTRIVMSPIYAQALLETLRGSLAQYVAAFGPLRDPGPAAADERGSPVPDSGYGDAPPGSDEE